MTCVLIPWTWAGMLQAMASQATRYGWENGQRVDDYWETPPTARPSRDSAYALSKLVCILLADNHPALGIECMALVTGLGYEGASMAEIARRHGVTRAAVSKRCVDLCDALGIGPVRAMRPEKNQECCKQARFQSLTEKNITTNAPWDAIPLNRKSPMRSDKNREKCRQSRFRSLNSAQ